MLIITYFLTFVLVISLILILLPYFKAYTRPKEQYKPLGSGREEFSEEFFSKQASQEDTPIDYAWKGALNKGVPNVPLPEGDQDHRLTLLIKNPTCLYAYWDIDQDLDIGTPVLRIYGPNPAGQREEEFSYLFETDITREAKNWFITVPKDNCSYYAELGPKLPDGSFSPLLRSNVVRTPRSSLSAAMDENWIPCDVYGGLGDISYGLSSGCLEKRAGKD